MASKAYKRRLEDKRNPYTGQNHGGTDPADMKWADVDAVAIWEECIRMQTRLHSEECNFGDHSWAPDVGDVDDERPNVGIAAVGGVSGDDVLAAMMSCA